MNNPQDIIASAERLVAELWEAKKVEDAQENQVVPEPAEAPLCPEAVEDEVKRVEDFAHAFAKESIEGLKSFMIAEIDLYGHDSLTGVAIYEIKGIMEFDCGKCDAIHEMPMRFSAIRMGGHGSLFPLESETILDRNKEIMEKRRAQSGGPQGIQLSLGDLVDGIAGRLKEKMAEKSDDPEEDELPPAAIVEEAEPEPATEITEIPVINITPVDEGDEELLGQIRRVWNRLWRR